MSQGQSSAEPIVLDARELLCPMPLLKAKRALNTMAVGEYLKIMATDQGSVRDFKVFCEQSGNHLVSSEEMDGEYVYLVCKREVRVG